MEQQTEKVRDDCEERRLVDGFIMVVGVVLLLGWVFLVLSLGRLLFELFKY